MKGKLIYTLLAASTMVTPQETVEQPIIEEEQKIIEDNPIVEEPKIEKDLEIKEPEIKETKDKENNKTDKKETEEEVEDKKQDQKNLEEEEDINNQIPKKTYEEDFQVQEQIDNAVVNKTPIYTYVTGKGDVEAVKMYSTRKKRFDHLLSIVKEKDNIKELNKIGNKKEEDKNKFYLDFLKGKYDSSKAYENKYTLYKGGFLLPLKNNHEVSSLYTEKNPRVVFNTKKGETVYSPINADKVIYRNGNLILSDTKNKINVVITNIESHSFIKVNAGDPIGLTKTDNISMYVQKDGDLINPILMIRSEIDRELEGFFGVPHMYQADERWALEPYGSMNLASAACGPSSIAMAVSYLNGDVVTPLNEVNNLGGSSSPHFISGVGSAYTIFNASASTHNIQSRQLGNNVNAVVESLKKGNPVVLSMHKGYFTTAGHFVLATGITKDGKIYVNDPASNLRGEDTYTPEFIASNMKNAFEMYNKDKDNTYKEGTYKPVSGMVDFYDDHVVFKTGNVVHKLTIE